ncbi:MAG: type II toxin-antitoxin system RelE/ParE family toxin [Nanoarchaeota archaeon]
MIFKIEFSKQATKFIKNLPDDLKERLKNKFKEISENPFRYLEHFEGEDCYKLRIGDFRGLIDVDFDRKILFVRVFDKRGRIYK